MRRLVVAGLPLVLGGVLHCTGPNLSGIIFSCQTDADCSGGRVCAPVSGGAKGCIERDAGGGGDIHIGMSAAFTGTSGNLGTEMRRGINAYFKKTNDTGGVQGGRHLVLDALDDQYQPGPAVLNTEQLLD